MTDQPPDGRGREPGPTEPHPLAPDSAETKPYAEATASGPVRDDRPSASFSPTPE